MKKIIGSLTAAVIAAGALAACGPNDKKDEGGSMSPAMSSDAMSPESAMASESAMSSDAMSPESAMSHGAMMSKGRFTTYDEYRAEPDKNPDAKTVLFFNATWCPSCQAITKALRENPDKIPEGTNIVSVDYDSNTELRQKYAVTTQHTFVQVDSEGNAVRTWSATDVDDAISGIQN